jgi:predicted transport protein
MKASAVAYKAETNFVDVVLWAKRLVLSLNITLPEINDPKGICRDVSGTGRWGNGEVELGLASLEELPYAIGLVRQALEKQLGTGEAG